MSKAEKLRLCNQILSAPTFKNLVRFDTIFGNVEERCERRRVSFTKRYVIARTRNTVYEEWVIGCKTLLIEENESVTLYISRGYGLPSVFLYGLTDELLYMLYYSSRISVWED
jgi:hypothetical protein